MSIGMTKETRVLLEKYEQRLVDARSLLVRVRDAFHEVRAGRLDSFTFSAIAEIDEQISEYLALDEKNDP